MNIDHAKAIPMSIILSKIGYYPFSVSEGKAIYMSPFRPGKTPTFTVCLESNSWYDFEIGRGGDVVAFVQCYLKSKREDHNQVDALRFLEIIANSQISGCVVPERASESGEEKRGLILKAKNSLQHLGLIRYVEKRGIDVSLARKLFLELRILNEATGKTHFVVGFQNEDDGFQFWSPHLKGTIKPEAITFIRGRRPKPDGVNIFRECFDYASAANNLPGQELEDDTIILNSLSCKYAQPYIKGYGYERVFTWFENDHAGHKAAFEFHKFVQSEGNLRHIKMNKMYAPHRTVNAWHMEKNGLTP